MLRGLATLKMFGRSAEQVDTIRDDQPAVRRHDDGGAADRVPDLARARVGRRRRGRARRGRDQPAADGRRDRLRPGAGGPDHRPRVLPAAAHAGDALPRGGGRPGRRRAGVRDPRRAGRRRGRCRPTAPRPASRRRSRPTAPIRFDGRHASRTRAATTPALDGLDLTHPAPGGRRAGRRDRRRQDDGRQPAAPLPRARRRARSSSATRRSARSTSRPGGAHVAWVPQRPHLFHGTVADNIRLARPDADDEAVRAAAREAGADAFIAALPAGYDDAGRRGRAPAQRRPAPADRDRPGVPGRRAAGHPRRGDLAPRRRPARRSSATRSTRLARDRGPSLVVSHRLRLVVGRGPRRRRSTRARRRDRPAGRARRPRRAVPPPARRRPPTPTRPTRDASFRRLFGLIGAAPPLDRDRGAARLPRRRLERRPDGDVGLPHLEVGARSPTSPRSRWSSPSVRVLAIARAAFRYLERYVTHRATFAILADLRVWFFAAIEPLAPGRPDRPSQRRPAGADRRRHRDARGLLRPGHRAAGRGRPRDGLRRRCCSGAFDPVLGVALVAFLVGDRGRPAARLAPAVARRPAAALDRDARPS